MATKRRTIKSRRETISARKKRGLLNPLQQELDKPLAKSFKEGAAVAAVVAGPGKFGKGASKIAQKIKAIRKARKADPGARPKPKGILKRANAAAKKNLEKAKGIIRTKQKEANKAIQKRKQERARFLKEDKAIDRALFRANKADTNVKRAAARAKLAKKKFGGFRSAAEQNRAKANVKDLRARSKASVKKNVADRKALGKRLEAQTKSEQLRIQGLKKIKTLRARSKASVKKNVAERKALRAKVKPKEKAGDRALLARAQKNVKAKKQLTIDEAGAIARKKAGITRPAQGGSTQLSAGNRFPLSRKIDPTEQKRLRDIRLRDERLIQKRASAKIAKRAKERKGKGPKFE